MAKLSEVLSGLEILRAYAHEPHGGLVRAGAGQLWAGPGVDDGDLPDDVELRLRKLGWFYDPKDGHWSHFT